MKLNKLALVGAFAVATLSSQAFAAQDATVNFNARLVAATCDISAKCHCILRLNYCSEWANTVQNQNHKRNL
ncbi:MAG: hypothetical protein WBO26_16290 [Providencia rettgeri]|uniref:hypothetical protein n=1 Tax=unclassified Providencia TaxID=2633465 RepID=UPI00234AEE55|nr:hypothetical protein [Providencia sp. PROV164]